MHPSTHLRVARPTDNLEEVVRFYREGLGFVELYRFENHQGFDGVMLGLEGAPYHLEFTTVRGHPYWDRLGLTFEDPDGYRVVLQHESWDR